MSRVSPCGRKIRQAYQEGEQYEKATPTLELILSDGTMYPHKGVFFLADRQVDVKTGTIRIAAQFPNPDNLLRPGQYGRVRALIQTREGALLVPQRAVTELQGGYQVVVVTADNKIEIRPVKVGERAGTLWVINEGLKTGERVVAEGLQQVKAGMSVSPKGFQAESKGHNKSTPSVWQNSSSTAQSSRWSSRLS